MDLNPDGYWINCLSGSEFNFSLDPDPDRKFRQTLLML